jgi:hypothetical protein
LTQGIDPTSVSATSWETFAAADVASGVPEAPEGRALAEEIVEVSRTSAVVLVVAALVILPIAASVSPFDPTWIEGIYDAADRDDVVMIVTWSSVAACSRIRPTTLGSETVASGRGPANDLVSPLRSFEEIVPHPGERYDSARSSQSTRGPPQRFGSA